MKDTVNEIRKQVECINVLVSETEQIKDASKIVYNVVLVMVKTAYVIVLTAKLTNDLKKLVEWLYPIRKETKLLPLGRG